MARLIPCTACESHVMESDRTCPHCGETLRASQGPRATWVLFSLAMAGCPAEDVYGAPDSSSDEDESEDGDTETDTGTDTDGETGTDGETDTGTETDTGG